MVPILPPGKPGCASFDISLRSFSVSPSYLFICYFIAMVALTRLVLVVSALVASVIAAPAPVSRAASKSGQGTFFAPGLGACGIHNSGSDMIVAVSQELFDHFP
ncbi:hypothetical protein EW146_g10485, partial [Bondarzewia mesenterica]